MAYGCHVFTQSDDYSGETLTNATVPIQYKSETKKKISIGKHCIVGTSSLIYVGNPAKKISPRSKNLLKLELQLSEENKIRKN